MYLGYNYLCMRIGIDARLIGETGVGRYIRNLLSDYQKKDTRNTYVLYLPPAWYETYTPAGNFEKRCVRVRWHTVWEQIVMPIVAMNDHLDVLHVPYFTVPILYPGKIIVTIHDLTVLHFPTGKATTLPYPFYALRYLGYLAVLSLGLWRASKVIAVSKATKQEIIDHFKVNPAKIQIISEGIDARFQHVPKKMPREIRGSYFLYVGNAYPHKNLEMLVRSFAQFLRSYPLYRPTKLVLVGKEDFFYKKLKRMAESFPECRSIVFFDKADDRQLTSLYFWADALVYPSKMEGFGLPTLEALTLGCPVVCSDIPVFHEILGDIPLYVDIRSTGDLTRAFVAVKTNGRAIRKRIKKQMTNLVKNYSWDKAGKETRELYEKLGPVSVPNI